MRDVAPTAPWWDKADPLLVARSEPRSNVVEQADGLLAHRPLVARVGGRSVVHLLRAAADFDARQIPDRGADGHKSIPTLAAMGRLGPSDSFLVARSYEEHASAALWDTVFLG